MHGSLGDGRERKTAGFGGLLHSLPLIRQIKDVKVFCFAAENALA